MEPKNKPLFYFLMFLIFSFLACEDEQAPKTISPEELEKVIYLQTSNWLVCPGQEIGIFIKDINGAQIDLSEVKIYLSPEIGTIDLQSGKYLAPNQIDGPLRIEILAEYKKDKNVKSGRLIHLRPYDPKSYILTGFSGIESAIDSGQLPDGSLVFASDNPIEPPRTNYDMFDFEIFCTDQKGSLLWHTNLGKGLLRRIFVGREVIYGIGYLDGPVVVQFDFQGNLLGKKYLAIEKEENWLTNESMIGVVNGSDEFICMLTHSNGNPSHTLFKFDYDLNLIHSISLPKPANRIVPLGNTGYLLTNILNGDFTVVDSNLSPLWNINFDPNGGSVNGVIENNDHFEIWTINEKEYTNEIYLAVHSTNGNQISTKRLPFSEKLFFNRFYALHQFENGDIWLIASSEDHSFEKPFFENEYIPNFFHLIKLSSSGEILQQAWIERMNFIAPDFPGGWPLKFFGLHQGKDGLLLSGKWYYNFLIQLNPENTFSPC
jgi:hypothetical protein